MSLWWRRGPARPGPAARAVLVRVEHPGADLPGLRRLVVAADQQRRRPGPARRRSASAPGPSDCGRTGLASPARRAGTGSCGPGGRRPGRGRRRPAPQVRRVGAAEPVDGLGVVADAGQAASRRAAAAGRCSAWTALTSWYSSTSTASNRPRSTGPAAGSASAARHSSSRSSKSTRRVPALVRHVVAEQAGQLAGERDAPREAGRDHLGERGRVHAPGVDVGAGRRPRRRAAGPTRPWSARSVSITSAASAGSMTLNCGGSENDSACARMIRCAMAWNVPPQIRSAEPPSAGARPGEHVVGGRRVKVSSRIRLGRQALAPAARPPGPPGSRSCRSRPRPGSAAGRPHAWPPGAARSFRPSRMSPTSNMLMNITRPGANTAAPRGHKTRPYGLLASDLGP